MTRRTHGQLTLSHFVLFGLVLPNPEAWMETVLRRIDLVLDDDDVVDHVVAVLRQRRPQSARRGRPSTPAEVAVRLLVLKHLKRWSYDQLEWEVTGSLVYRRFCRIDAGKVPDAKTMVRLGQLLAGAPLRALFERVTLLAVDTGVAAGRKMRVDTTVVEAPIRYPTDSGLCEDVVRVLRRTTQRLVEAGVKLSFRLRHVGRSMSHRMREIAQALRLRGDAAKKAIKKPYRKLLRITGRVIRQARRAAERAPSSLASLTPAAQRAVERALSTIAAMLPRAQQIVRQTRARILRGVTDSAGKTRRIRLDEILVVTPYNAQVRALADRLPDGVRVGTVDKFQGQEAAVVFFSMATSSGAELPRNLEFLFSRNRLNVAISRAQCLAVLVASPGLLRIRCRTVEQMQMVNALCRLVEVASR